MKRLKLFLMITALLVVMAVVVVFRSPYAPVVGGPVDIEVLWGIEDERVESETPLVTKLMNHGVPLAYVEEENTFYCTLGLEHKEDWPELHLTAPGAMKGVQICFVDDYAYDWCDEAIRKGYSYELMAYTEQEYSYFYIVFTGLPILSIDADATIADVDTPADIVLSAYDEPATATYARIHRRGGLTRSAEKPPYKVEFTRRMDGTDKVSLQIPKIGYTDELVLMPMPFDGLFMRDRLSWDVLKLMTPEKKSFAARDSAYVEVIVNGEYAGIYLMLMPFDIDGELGKMGAEHLRMDGVYRTCVFYMSDGRMLIEHPIREGAGYELFYSAGNSRQFEPLKEYLQLIEEKDDTVFAQKALACIDLQDMLNMQILLQAGGMTDNVFNNLYIWAEKTGHGYIYHYIPWDMDLSWGLKKEDIGEQFENWMYFPTADRLINLNPEGVVRDELLKTWKQAKERALNLETITRLTDGYERELNDSGAMRRNAERWGTENYEADAQEILEFAEIRFDLLNETIERLAQNPDESAVFLERTQYEGKSSMIEW